MCTKDADVIVIEVTISGIVGVGKSRLAATIMTALSDAGWCVAIPKRSTRYDVKHSCDDHIQNLDNTIIVIHEASIPRHPRDSKMTEGGAA